MKKELLHVLKKNSVLMILSFMLFFVSCAIGYHDDETFTSGVKDSQLESPDLSKLAVKSIIVDGKEKLFIEWPVVYGAGGYEFSLYSINDPEHPVLIGDEKQIVEKCSVTRDKSEDTKYEVLVRALGNEKDNNKTAIDVSKGYFNTFVPTVAVIPDGTDLAEYFAANPVTQSDIERGYELIAGGSYTLNGALDFAGHQLTIHGTKGDNSKIVYGAEGKLSTWGGLKLKYLDIDCSAIPAGKSDGALLLLSKNPNDSIKGKDNYFIIENEIAIQDCNVKGINQYLVYDNGVKYAVKRFRIQNSVIELNTKSHVVLFDNGFINETYLMSSTFYGLVESSNIFLKYNNSGRPEKIGATGGFNIKNNTFYNIVKKGKMGDYSGMNHKSTYFNMSFNIFVDCGSGEVARRIMHTGANMAKDLGMNNYWFNGAFPAGEINYDKSINIIKTNPELRDPANGDFTVGGAQQIADRVGDPRWLPVVSE